MNITNPVVANAMAARHVATNALDVEQQRANEADRPKVEAAFAKINAKGAALAKEIRAYHAEMKKMNETEKRLKDAVRALQKEGRAEFEKLDYSRLCQDPVVGKKIFYLREGATGWEKGIESNIQSPSYIPVPFGL